MLRIFIFSLILLSAGCSKRPKAELQEIGSFDTTGWAHDVLLEKDKLYVADRQGGFLTFDHKMGWKNPSVSTPVADVISLDPHSGNPILASRFEGLVLVSGDSIIARYSNGDIANAVVTRGDYAFAAYGLHGLVIMRVSKDNLGFLAELKSPGWSHDVKLAGDWALLADWDYGLRVVDIRKPGQPAEMGVLPTPATAIAISVADSGVGRRIALAEGHAGVALVSIDDAGRPHLLCRNTLGLNAKDSPHPEAGGWAHDVAWCGPYVFVANWKRGLSIMDAQDASHPRVILEYPCSGTALGVAAVHELDGAYLIYLADGEAGLRILRFSPN